MARKGHNSTSGEPVLITGSDINYGKGLGDIVRREGRPAYISGLYHMTGNKQPTPPPLTSRILASVLNRHIFGEVIESVKSMAGSDERIYRLREVNGYRREREMYVAGRANFLLGDLVDAYLSLFRRKRITRSGRTVQAYILAWYSLQDKEKARRAL